jgi:ATP-binding cassette subfamily B protein
VAQAASFVADMPEGYDTAIAQGGSNLSGGQKQRLSIARALVRKPEIYIFDDSFSALDFKTDAQLRAALKKETEESAVIIVAQRVSTVMDADRILVLDDGVLVGSGSHKELVKSCQVYREIVSSQLSEEEMKAYE